jgi:microcystin-dependent protein
MSYLYPAHPNNITDLSTIVVESVTPQLRMCQNVLYYSQAIIGDYKYSARSDDHLGWLVCDGRLLDRVQNKALFDVIGTTFGNTTSSNFRMPDFRGRVFGGLNVSGNRNNSYSVRNLGDAVGAETHTLTIPQIPSHNHNVTDPGHTHSYVNQSGDQNTDNAFNTETAADQVDNNQTTGSSTTGISINNTGGGEAHNNMQPTVFGGNVYVFAGLPGDPPSD